MPRLYLFDDARARSWEPLALTRPVGELLFGCLLQRERAERAWGEACAGHLAGDLLVGFEEPGSPPGISPGEVDPDEGMILFSSRVVPTWDERPATDEGPASLVVDERVVGWILAPGDPVPDEGVLREPDRSPAADRVVELEGWVLETPWDAVARNAEQITRDVEMIHPHAGSYLPAGVSRIGKGAIYTGHAVEMEEGVVLDVRDGPIHLSDRVTIQAPARIVGPAFFGPDTVVFGGPHTHVSVGPVCKLRGEIEACVFLGYDNKAHDGYLGHAYLGRWVNLGAMTTNSDLKNNYSPVRVTTAGGEVDTGLLKVGCFLGDHVKTGIGTLLNTGTVVGAGSNLFGGAMPPKYVPPFSWGSGDELSEFRLEKFLETAGRVMERRDVELDEAMEVLLRRAFEETRDLRGGS